MAQATFRIWRGDQNGGAFRDYTAEVGEGMVVLDCIHQIQATQAPDLACRWNCKAGKCGSCSAEINGRPRLMCMTRLDDRRFIDLREPIIVEPMRTFPHIKDLVTDVSWNYKVNRMIPKFQPRKPDAADGTWRMSQAEVDRIQEFRKCIECFLCQDTCHVLRDHRMMGDTVDGELRELFGGPRFMIRVASLEMHPLDIGDRLQLLKDTLNIGLCNITKCCTEVCPEHIHITDNGIIPLKERVVDRFYDPLMWLWHRIFGDRASRESAQNRTPLPVVSS
ncbi:MAG: succinate dehydrogenase/fumarate reductase iron-sulfur subunit [Gemmataceae bacterium]|nr:succinate dehydrogenase/fumarate reductase iron-sulfur subunit [Gemmataceae bacterium]MDW8267376.1 succinate dehydrogenase/fumarate reductase iron-sulfur subunit [Gemmataceae bacterium]